MKDKDLLTALEKSRFDEFQKAVQCIYGVRGIAAYTSFWLADLAYGPHSKWEFLAMRITVAIMCLCAFIFPRKSIR